MPAASAANRASSAACINSADVRPSSPRTATPTLATITTSKVPERLLIDGADQTHFFTGKQQKSARDGFVVYVGNDLFGVKWKNWKVMFKELARGGAPIQTFTGPKIYNLLVDPKEEHTDVYKTENFWVMRPARDILKAHQLSLKEHPPIAPGTPDPEPVG